MGAKSHNVVIKYRPKNRVDEVRHANSVFAEDPPGSPDDPSYFESLPILENPLELHFKHLWRLLRATPGCIEK